MSNMVAEDLVCWQVYADTLIKKAYENWTHVVEYDGKSLLSLKQNKIEDSSRTESPVSQPNPNFYTHELSLPSLPVAPPMEQPSVDPGLKIGGINPEIHELYFPLTKLCYGRIFHKANASEILCEQNISLRLTNLFLNVSGLHDAMGTRYSAQSQTMNFNGSAQYATSLLPQNQFIGTSGLSQPSRNNDALSLGPAQPSLSGLQPVGTSNFVDYRGNENLLSEEDIRMRSHQMLEHEDMQHLLRIFGMGNGGHQAQNPVSVTEDPYPYSAGYAPSPAINFNFDEDRSRSSGKAVVGWLKLKAALRWGIFIRKKAAERRAQLVELDDT